MYCYCGKKVWFQNFPELNDNVMHVEFLPQKVQSGPLGRAYSLGTLKLWFRASLPWKSDRAVPCKAAKLASSKNELGNPGGSPMFWVGCKAWPHTWEHIFLGVSAAQLTKSNPDAPTSSSLVSC